MASKVDQADYDVVNEDYDTHRDGEKQNSSKKSSMSGKSSRYFQVDPGYDKKVYENDCRNVFVILFVFLMFYMFNIFYWWGLTAFGTAYPEPAKWYSVAVFAATVVWGVGMLIQGRRANLKLYRWEFYMEKINDAEQKLREKEVREQQKRDQEAKIAADKAKLAEVNGYTKKPDNHNTAHNSVEEEQKFDDMKDNDSDEHHSILLNDRQ